MNIHSVVIVIIGAFVAIASNFLGDHMRIFFYIGLVILAFGLVQWLLLRPGKNDVPMPKPKMQGQYCYCFQCGAALPLHARFCGKCGCRVQ